MFREFAKVRQEERWEGYRRVFFDDDFELYVWYHPNRDIHGFQLCYWQGSQQKAFTWRENRGVRHDRVDVGWPEHNQEQTPLLIPNGHFPADQLRQRLQISTLSLDQRLREIILDKIAENHP